MSNMVKPITIFISYAHEDDVYLRELQKVLKPYLREKKIEVWTDKDIVAGEEWNELIKARLNSAKIILFLVSIDFLDSDYINDTEIKAALENNKIISVPVIIRPIDLSMLKINYLQVIPSGAKAVTKWESRDEAWIDVVKSLKVIFEKINNDYPGTQDEPVYNSTIKNALEFNRSNFSDKLVKWVFVVMIFSCFGVFLYGLIGSIPFVCFAALAGMGIGLTGYFFMRKVSVSGAV